MSIVYKLEQTPEQYLSEFEELLKKAVERKASDVHLKTGLPVVVRVNGQLYYLNDEGNEAPPRLSSLVIQGFAYAVMTPHQATRYEAGEEIDCSHEIAGFGRFRINICQQKSHPRIVARHIPDMIKNLDDLGLPPILKDLCSNLRGLILVTGTTGSGKSTTLAAMIDYIVRTRSCHVLTIEDPIEFNFKDRKSVVTQREVGLDTDSFSKALKFALRQDPDVILIGEMRDEETVRMALSAAETGHLVLSTLHTQDAPETINRILSNIEPEALDQVRSQLANVLIGVVSQRLVKTIDRKGRCVATEILVTNARVRELIADPLKTIELANVIEVSGHQGMQSFDQCLLALVKTGKVSKEEALTQCTHLENFQLMLSGITGGKMIPAGEEEKILSRKDRIQRASATKTEISQKIEIDFKPKKG